MKPLSLLSSLSCVLALGAAAPHPQLNGIGCYGCVVESKCRSYDGDPDFSFNTYYLLDRWMSTFGS